MKKTVLTILCALFGLFMIFGGVTKFINMEMEMTPEQLLVYGYLKQIVWLMPLVGVVEIVGGILIAIPRTRALGALVLLPIMIGIVVHLLSYTPGDLALIGPFFVLNVAVIIENYKKYAPMLEKN